MVKTWNEKLFHIDGAKVTNYYFPLKLHKNKQSQKMAHSLSLSSIGDKNSIKSLRRVRLGNVQMSSSLKCLPLQNATQSPTHKPIFYDYVVDCLLGHGSFLCIPDLDIVLPAFKRLGVRRKSPSFWALNKFLLFFSQHAHYNVWVRIFKPDFQNKSPDKAHSLILKI